MDMTKMANILDKGREQILGIQNRRKLVLTLSLGQHAASGFGSATNGSDHPLSQYMQNA
jgi:hypothetical protein